MGCCISSNKAPDHHHFPSKHELPLPHLSSSRAPPPCLEEETVKEVVHSETCLPKPQDTHTHTDTHIPVPLPVPVIEVANNEAKDLMMSKHEEEISQASQVSEIYSISESFSTTTTTTTTTITERREDEAISKPTGRRSPAKVPRKRPSTAEISRGAKSPAKRAETSKGAGATSRSGTRRTMPRNVGPTGVRRESGEGGPSVRRSRSPATRTVGGGGVGRSPGKVTGRAGGSLRVENEVKKELKEKENDGVLEQRNMLNESFDNPHVSLECFIFL